MPCQPLMRANIHDLQQAVIHGYIDDVKHILDMDTVNDLNATVCGSTALSLTLYRDKDAIFKLILCHQQTKKALNVNKLSKDDKQRLEPPIVTAGRLGNRDAVKLLVKYGADLEGKDNFNHTALWMATRQRFTDLVQYLIKQGASVNPSKLWSHSPLFFAVKYSSKRNDIAKLLINSGASLQVDNSTSLLYWSIVQGNINVAKLIVDAGYHVSSDGKIRLEYVAGTLTRNTNLISWLNQELHNPPSLQRQCRTQIRTHISDEHNGIHFIKKLSLLPLPRRIIGYLKLRDISDDTTDEILE